MVSLASLALPIVVASVIVFVASFVVHMVLPFHRGDLRRFPREDAVLEALRGFDIPPGDYAAPHAGSPEAMKDPAFLEKMQKGPLVLMTLSAGGSASMGQSLAQWFLYLVVVNLFAAYVCAHALPPGAHYRAVFRMVGATAFMGYALALIQNSIWYRRNWGSTLRSVVDGLLYGLLAGGTFGWLWPR